MGIPGLPFRRGFAVTALALVGVAALLHGSCRVTEVGDPEPAVQEDPLNVVHSVRMEDARPVDYRATPIPQDAFERVPFDTVKPQDDLPAPRAPDRVHPLLQRWLEGRPSSERERIVVSFRDPLRIPRFPEPALGEPRNSPANQRALERAEALVRDIEERRTGFYEERARELRTLEAEVFATYWLVSAMLVEIPLGVVRQLVDREDVLYLEPLQTEDTPPQNANNADDVDDGRARISSDPYFNLGQTGGFIGLLDTGIRRTHVLFNAPSNIDFFRDCVNGGSDCNTQSIWPWAAALNPADDCWNHGTKSAGIISANNRLGNPFRGVTAVTLDSWKVYPTSFNATGGCNGGLDTNAAIRGFERAVATLARVVVAEMQGSGNYLSAISVAGDNAFDAGAVVIAANGNNGPASSTVNAPASAHRVLGVGNFDVQTLAQVNSQSRGPTPDNRFKPDIQAPTNTETASNANNTALARFGGTSGATPYAAGAAALARNFLRGNSGVIDPGQVYAFLIMAGQQPAFNNTSGAGPLRLPTDGWAWWGKTSITNGGTINIPISVPAGTFNRLDAAIWWPETAQQFLGVVSEQHNDVDLRLVDPGGTVRAASISVNSVFERARVAAAINAGQWTIRVRGFSVPAGPQTVYFTAAAWRQ